MKILTFLYCILNSINSCIVRNNQFAILLPYSIQRILVPNNNRKQIYQLLCICYNIVNNNFRQRNFMNYIRRAMEATICFVYDYMDR